MPLLWRVFTFNAVILVVATLVLAVSPATISFPIALTELLVLSGGLAVMLGADLVLLRRAFGPLSRLTRVMRRVDPLQPGIRSEIEASDPEVAQLAEAFDQMLARLEGERRESARRALAAQENERMRIARELHDEVGQALTAVMLQLERALSDAEGAARADVAEAKELVRTTLEEIREIARRLRPEALDDLGLASAIAALTLDVSRRTGLRVERRIGELPALTDEQELVVYRVAQEALTNVARHADARAARVTLGRAGDRVVLEVHDDGRGLPTAVADGSGLLGMRERAMLIGADLELSSRAGRGTIVTLRLA